MLFTPRPIQIDLGHDDQSFQAFRPTSCGEFTAGKGLCVAQTVEAISDITCTGVADAVTTSKYIVHLGSGQLAFVEDLQK